MDNETYAFIIISLITFGLLFALIKRKFSVFWSTVWDFASVILSDIFARRITGNIQRIIAGIWLMVCILLLSLYSGGLYEMLVCKQPIDKINSWDDLYSNPRFKDVNIHASVGSQLAHMIDKDDSSPMIQNFKKRTLYFNFVEIMYNKAYRDSIVESIVKGDAVFMCSNRFILNYLLYKWNYTAIKQSEGIDFVISKRGIGVRPHFLVFTNRTQNVFKQQINKM